MMRVAVVALAFLVAFAAADREVFLTRDSVPAGWHLGGFAEQTTPVNFMIALHQRNVDALDRLFWAVSDPQSEEYQNYMSIDEILDLVAPEPEQVEKVLNWLSAHGITKVVNYRDGVEVFTDVRHAEKLFNAKYHTFFHDDGRKIARVYGEASMPKKLKHIVSFFEGVSHFPIEHLGAHVQAAAGQPGVIPQTLYNIYEVPSETPQDAPNTSVGVIEFEQQNYAPSDLAQFAKLVNVKVVPLTTAHTVGPNDPSQPQIEPTLDIQEAATVNGDSAVAWFWLESGNGWLYQYVNHYFSTQDVPQVASISYGWSESNQCQIDGATCQKLGVNSEGYVERVNAEFQKIGLRGLTILVASGDSGANGRTDPQCTLPFLKPDYPAACPYITAVGATQLVQTTPLNNGPPICTGHGFECVGGGLEEAVSYAVANFASGGGFSNYAPQPSYQKTAVEAYLAMGEKVKLPPASYFNATNRGYPDVAAIGNACLIYQGGVQSVGGTSCAAPEWAGVVSVLNQAAISKTGAPLGFLNPFLYQMQAAQPNTFHDITIGNNICTEDGCAAACKGFTCAVGWDPVSGLGSPNTNNIISYINANL